MTDDRVDVLAAALAEAHRTASPVDPDDSSASGFPESIDDAYRVQTRLVDRLTADRGDPVGYKIGFTNERVRTDLGVDEPAYGRLLEATVVDPPATVAAAEFVGVRIEPEIAFRLGDDLPADASRARARDAVATVHPAIELVDSRTGWTFDAPLAVADNCLDAGLVLGAGTGCDDRPLGEEAVALRVDGERVDSGVGADVLGFDAQRKMARGARQNLRHFLPDGTWAVGMAEAGHLPLCDGTDVDGVVFDAPYGRQSKIQGELHEVVQGALEEAARVADRAVVVGDRPWARVAGETGWMTEAAFHREVHRSLTRHVIVLERRRE